MKIHYILYLAISLFILNSCETEEFNEDDLLTPEQLAQIRTTRDNNPPSTKASLSAKIDGELIDFKPLTSKATNFNFIGVQSIIISAAKNDVANDISIQIKINRKDLKLGEYTFNSFSGLETSVLFNNPSNDNQGIIEMVDTGTLTITSIDTAKGVVSGTFNMKVDKTKFSPTSPFPEVIETINVTEGTFTFSYELTP